MEVSTLIMIVIVILILTEVLLLASTLYYDITDNILTLTLIPILFVAIGGLAAAFAFCKNVETERLQVSGDISTIRSMRQKKTAKKDEGAKMILSKIEEVLNLQKHGVGVAQIIDPETKSKFDSLEPRDIDEEDDTESSSEDDSDDDKEGQDPGLALVQNSQRELKLVDI